VSPQGSNYQLFCSGRWYISNNVVSMLMHVLLEPSCLNNAEFCVELWARPCMNDQKCNVTIDYMCEYGESTAVIFWFVLFKQNSF
jgi:hypothetical protein